jgi:hypothetical protein
VKRAQRNGTARLDDLEGDLHARLIVDLPQVAAGWDSLYFYNPDQNPCDFRESRLSARGVAAYRLAGQIRDLREQLGASRSCDALLLLKAIEDHADRSDAHRLGAKRLAAKLLEEIGKLISTGAG